MDEWVKTFRHLLLIAGLCFGSIAIFLTLIAARMVPSNLPLLLFLAGAGGSIVATYRRLAKITDATADVQRVLATPPVIVQLYVSPIIGGVFAMIMWAAFFSGIIRGPLFPEIVNTAGPYDGLANLMAKTNPNTFADAMKGIFWAFLAGYSEKFVPNVLDKLGEKAEGK